MASYLRAACGVPLALRSHADVSGCAVLNVNIAFAVVTAFVGLFVYTYLQPPDGLTRGPNALSGLQVVAIAVGALLGLYALARVAVVHSSVTAKGAVNQQMAVLEAMPPKQRNRLAQVTQLQNAETFAAGGSQTRAIAGGAVLGAMLSQ